MLLTQNKLEHTKGLVTMLVLKWEKEQRNFRRQNPAETTYSVDTYNGEKLFQIQTYGSPARQEKGKASQILQFNKQQAIELIEILKNEFTL